MATVEEIRAAEFRRKMTARARWTCDQALRAFPGNASRAAALRAATEPLRPDPGWDPAIDCSDDDRGLQVP